MQRGLNPPPKHGPIFLIMKAETKRKKDKQLKAK
jgi:hypothetical protein